MTVEIKRKRPISFGIKVAIAVIFTSVILGGLHRITGDSSQAPEATEVGDIEIVGANTSLLVPVLKLPVARNSLEKEWTAALAKRLKGKPEVSIDRGRIDVLTESYAIEIDFAKKWHEGLGQAIHYGADSKRIGVLALVDETRTNEQDPDYFALMQKIERLCLEKGVKLVFLRPEA